MPGKLPWFTTKGQIAQLGFALAACIFSGIKAWPDMQKTDVFTPGAILFYLLVGLVISIIVVLIRSIARHRSQSLNRTRSAARHHSP
jgi:hypothetical protein